VDGPAIFDKVTNCQVAVAAQQFQVCARVSYLQDGVVHQNRLSVEQDSSM
jgi:hypothetical protein